MASGMSYDPAHAAALEQAGLSPFSLYHQGSVDQHFQDKLQDGSNILLSSGLLHRRQLSRLVRNLVDGAIRRMVPRARCIR
jgi:hypothetical protein